MLELTMEDIKHHVEPKNRHIGTMKRVMPDYATVSAVETKPEAWVQPGRPPSDPLIETVGHWVSQPCSGLYAASVDRRGHNAGCFGQEGGIQEVVYQPNPVEGQVAREGSLSRMGDVQMSEYRDRVVSTSLESHVAANGVGGQPILEVQRRGGGHSRNAMTHGIHCMEVERDHVRFNRPSVVQPSTECLQQLGEQADEAAFEATLVGVILCCVTRE